MNNVKDLSSLLTDGRTIASLSVETHVYTWETHANTDAPLIHRGPTDSLIHFLYPLEAAPDYAIHPKAIIHLYQ